MIRCERRSMMDPVKKIIGNFEEFSEDENVTNFLKEIFSLEDKGLRTYRDKYKELVDKYYIDGDADED